MSDTYTREQIVRKLRKLRRIQQERTDRYHLKGWQGSSNMAYNQVLAFDEAIAAFPLKKRGKK